MFFSLAPCSSVASSGRYHHSWWQLRCWNLFFYVGSSGSGKDGVCIGEKRTRTHEMCDVTQEAEFTDEPVVNPFKYEVNKPMKQVVTPTSGFAKSTGSNGNEVGKRNSLAKDSKPGFRSKNTRNARFGHNRSNLNVGVMGMQVRGSNVQDDVQGLISFNMELNEGKSRLVKSGVSNEDEHDSVGEVGLVGMLTDFDASDVEAGQCFPQLELSDCTRLNGEVSDVEIQSSLFAIGGLKMPGPLGFQRIKLVCSQCGCYRHGRDTCPVILKAKAQVAEIGNAKDMEVNTPAKEDDLDAFDPKKVGEGMLLWQKNFKKKFQKEQGPFSVNSTKASPQIEEGFKNAYSSPIKYEVSKPTNKVVTPASDFAKSTGSN
ncbi:unnamed protein product [Prunus armeniaca]